ncbi:hypothetical protein M5689_020593 [Euphorbia peplus]|nr:hypothetical protein M5689_020593 [Euphorbia peplus]
MSSQYEEIKEATIPLFLGSFNEDRYNTTYIKEAWVNWYTVVRVYDDGYAECIYSDEYDIDCECHTYNPDSSWYDDQRGCYVKRVCHSHEDRYGPYDEIWEHLRKENPLCSEDYFYCHIGENQNFYRSCKQSCFAESSDHVVQEAHDGVSSPRKVANGVNQFETQESRPSSSEDKEPKTVAECLKIRLEEIDVRYRKIAREAEERSQRDRIAFE